MTELRSILKKHVKEFHSVVTLDHPREYCIALDLTASNNELTPPVFNDTIQFSEYISQKIHAAGARYAIGGYNEYRSIYERSEVFDPADSGSEPRRRHLGLDIWSVAGTPVYCPLQAIVHSTGMNNQHGDYGATIILEHELENCRFFTLYGHLSAKDLKIDPGTSISAGEKFCHFGDPGENGNWPPHLHFQIIHDIGIFRGDYPGVCGETDVEYYLYNCPDPDLIARMNRFIRN